MDIFSTGELKNASLCQLNRYCEDIRKEIYDTVNVCGGHLSSNLGIVELTVALHRVFQFPQDKIIFDVGHQCYAHKILSGRAEKFHTLRRRGGLSGFPKREESEYDCYNTGHAGTAISAALGFSKARDLMGESYHVIALVGDGAFNNGLIYEALNSIRILKSRVLIILNDNGMSISPTVGGMHDILEDVKGGKRDFRIFEQFGLNYLGPYDGNKLEQILPALEQAKKLTESGSVLLHVVTRKGYGYPFCENAPTETHGVSPAGAAKREYSSALGEELSELARENDRVVAVTAAMTESLGLKNFFRDFPDRAFDVGICEEHASVLCASMAAAGMKPYFAIYSTFLQRAFDEVIHDICGQDLPVTFCVDRAGVSGSDGETHQGVFDLSYLSMIPNLTIAIPKDIGEFRAMLRASVHFAHPLAIRYPREGTESAISDVEIGKFEVLHSTTSDIIVFGVGERCLKLAESVRRRAQDAGFDFSVVNARFLKPLDEAFLSSLREKYIITLEDNVLRGGFGERILDFFALRGKEVYRFGYPDCFLPHGSVEELSEEFGLSEESVFACVSELYARG